VVSVGLGMTDGMMPTVDILLSVVCRKKAFSSDSSFSFFLKDVYRLGFSGAFDVPNLGTGRQHKAIPFFSFT